MKQTDKFLIGIVAGAILLVIIALVVAVLQPKATYQPEDTPEGVANNYLLALQQADYPRAYSYLSPTIKSYPASAEAFANDIARNNWQFRELQDGSITLTVEASQISGNVADVSVRQNSFYPGGLFSSSQNTSLFKMQLQRDPAVGVWQITSADSFWVWCWNEKDGCK